MKTMLDAEIQFMTEAVKKHGNEEDKQFLGFMDADPETVKGILSKARFSIKKYVGSDYIYLWKGSRVIAGGKVIVEIDEMGKTPKAEVKIIVGEKNPE